MGTDESCQDFEDDRGFDGYSAREGLPPPERSDRKLMFLAERVLSLLDDDHDPALDWTCRPVADGYEVDWFCSLIFPDDYLIPMSEALDLIAAVTRAAPAVG